MKAERIVSGPDSAANPSKDGAPSAPLSDETLIVISESRRNLLANRHVELSELIRHLRSYIEDNDVSGEVRSVSRCVLLRIDLLVEGIAAIAGIHDELAYEAEICPELSIPRCEGVNHA